MIYWRLQRLRELVMRYLRLAAAFVAVMGAQSAFAADMPMKTPAPVLFSAPSWNGFYLGVAGGYGWGTSEQSDVSIFGPFSSGQYDINGAVIGGTLGYNFQTGAAVFGIETDLSWASIKGSTVGTGTAPGCISFHCETEIQALGTLRGRLGYAWGNWLPFVAGGLAYARLHGAEGPAPGGLGGSGAKWVAGWTIGAGVEAMIAPRWSLKAEYLYVDLGKHEVFTDTLGGGAQATENLEPTAHIVRVGVNYHFTGW
jgi:outer membrane immunogenic protein